MHPESQIKLIADTLLPGFIPKNANEKELSFHFTIPPNKSYKVNYKKNPKNEWVFEDYEIVEN
ncbi:MAG: hypothetical protein P0Y49_18855 [Candidatus Pedobacter colombiensis]|uniref:Uncharacterized protein n=1 Tax=Candidatus Pedobacter colombiensis TaxID=3121371 RepID=A0AAJ5W886_9SPHI|nr:hypothetical protein [Pedobacter sp.]WEK18839.1 MAG: hypothetical protein P0Y49_18855 [Pedobacter sp.]